MSVTIAPGRLPSTELSFGSSSIAEREIGCGAGAAGRCGAYYELALSLWDYAAGMLIVQEAGGDCRSLDGAALPLDPSRPSVAAGGKRALGELLALAKEIG